MSKHQQTGMRGVYLVASELAARGLIASPTSRSAAGADLLVTDENCANAFSVQVKTNAKPAGFWLAGAKTQNISSPQREALEDAPVDTRKVWTWRQRSRKKLLPMFD